MHINNTLICIAENCKTAKYTLMATMKFFLAILFVIIIGSTTSDGLVGQWCVADEQATESELKFGLDWACGPGGANCSKIQMGQACFQPNTMRAHASYAFNNYFQKMKHRGGNCYFKGSAIVTDLDPSYSSCNYELTP